MQIVELKHGDGARSGEAHVVFSHDEKYFEGHFPYAPILPGVVLIDAALEIVSRVTQKPLRWTTLSCVKFCNVVQPDQEICFTFKIVSAEDGDSVLKLVGRWMRGREKIADVQGVATDKRGPCDAS